MWTKNCDSMFDIFYRDVSKSWIFFFIYVPLSISLCDNNNVITRTGSITSFDQRISATKFCTGILERVFESSKIFFSQIKLDFFKYFPNLFSFFWTRNFSFHYFFWTTASIFIYLSISYCCCFKDILFIKVPFLVLLPCDNLTFACLSVWIFVWAIKYVKIDKFSRNFDRFLQ